MELINQKKSPIQDDYIEKYLVEKDLNLTATLDAKVAYKDADFVVIAALTNYNSKKNFFDTSAVENVIELVIEYNPDAVMVIKSTIPVGYTASIREKYHCDNIIFSPEFLRESKALYDNLYPLRIIVGTDVKKWLNEDGTMNSDMLFVTDLIVNTPMFSYATIMTTSRYIDIPYNYYDTTRQLPVLGLEDSNIAQIIKNNLPENFSGDDNKNLEFV